MRRLRRSKQARVRFEGRTPTMRFLSCERWQKVQAPPLWQSPLEKYKQGLHVPDSWLWPAGGDCDGCSCGEPPSFGEPVGLATPEKFIVSSALSGIVPVAPPSNESTDSGGGGGGGGVERGSRSSAA